MLYRSCWHNNKYIKGAYSYRSLKLYESNSTLQDLQSPLYSTCTVRNGECLQVILNFKYVQKLNFISKSFCFVWNL